MSQKSIHIAHLNSSNLKKDSAIINQVSRQNVKMFVEKGFQKLMNNANFGWDCQNNMDNCKFAVLYDEIEEVSYIQNMFCYFLMKCGFTCLITMKE